MRETIKKGGGHEVGAGGTCCQNQRLKYLYTGKIVLLIIYLTLPLRQTSSNQNALNECRHHQEVSRSPEVVSATKVHWAPSGHLSF